MRPSPAFTGREAEGIRVVSEVLRSILRNAIAHDEQLISRCLPHSGGRLA